MKAEDRLYEAHSLGIRDEVFDEVKKIRQDFPYMKRHLSKLKIDNPSH